MKLRVIAVADLEVAEPEEAVQLQQRVQDVIEPMAIQAGAVWTHYATRIRRDPDDRTRLRKMRVFAVVDLDDTKFRDGIALQDRIEAACNPYFDAYGALWRFFDTQIRRDRGDPETKGERLRLRTTEEGALRIS